MPVSLKPVDGWFGLHKFLTHSGLEADQKVIAAHDCYAMTATTALTAQNTKGVYDIHYIPPEFLRKQIDAVIEDVGVDVVKTGEPLLPLTQPTSLTLTTKSRHARVRRDDQNHRRRSHSSQRPDRRY